jgi:hypothetical protein
MVAVKWNETKYWNEFKLNILYPATSTKFVMDEIVCRRPMGCVQSIIENMKLIITNLSTLREGGLKSENTKGRY